MAKNKNKIGKKILAWLMIVAMVASVFAMAIEVLVD